jgi:copper resistance protein C
VLGHAELATMTPADKSTVPAPTEIVATFTETLNPAGSSLTLVDSTSKVVVQGGTVDATNKKTMRLDVSTVSLAPGTYEIRWTSKSAADGDLDRNKTTFTVAAASPSPSVAPASQSGSAPSAPPSASPTVAPSPSASGGTGTAASSTSDALIPILAVIVVIALLGLWLLRGRSRRVS